MTEAAGQHKFWHSRGYLPHFDAPNVVQTITFRLADSLPKLRLLEWSDKMSRAQKAMRFQQIEDALDRGHGECLLRDPRAAALVEETLLKFDGERYRLLAWVIMPNHVHVIVELLAGWSMSKVLHSWKSFTANAINRLFGRTGSLWQPDYFDRYIRDGQHFDNALRYIEYNPVRAKLAMRSHEWRYSSAWHRGCGV